MVDEFIIYNQRVYACSHLSNLQGMAETLRRNEEIFIDKTLNFSIQDCQIVKNGEGLALDLQTLQAVKLKKRIKVSTEHPSLFHHSPGISLTSIAFITLVCDGSIHYDI